jgi:hypothetical protein
MSSVLTNTAVDTFSVSISGGKKRRFGTLIRSWKSAVKI